MTIRTPLGGLVVSAGYTLLAALTCAQDTSVDADRDAQSPPLSATELIQAGLETTPFQSELLGLSIHLPEDSQVTVHQEDGGVSVLVSDPSAIPPQWTIRIGLLTSNMEVPTPQHEIDAHIKSLDATGREYTVLRNEDHPIRNAIGRHLTIRQAQDGQREPVVSGWFLLQNSDRTFLVLSYVTSPRVYQLLQPLLDASLGTIELQSLAELDQARGERINAGLQFLTGLSKSDLQAMVGQVQWLRVYRPTVAGDDEIGYSFVQVSESKRGEVEPGRSEDNFRPGEHETGIMVTVQGRVLNDAARRVFTDSIARFWVGWNQENEVWGVRATIRQGEAALSESETGARHRAALPNKPRTLTVVKTSQRDRATQPVTWDVPQAYLSQGLGWLVGRLLAHQEAPARSQSYYYYDATSNRIVLRTDEWEQATTGPGYWKLRTRLGTDAPAVLSHYDQNGSLVRQDRMDGTIIEPIDLATLRRIWQEKGLPTSSGNR